MHHLTHDAFDEDYRAAAERDILASPYLGDSPLGPEFVATKGFSILFRRTTLDEVCAAFGFLRDFLEEAVFPASNAFYVNPLVMKRGSRVDPHVDCRLVERENVRIIPTLVSIYYVRSDAESGGRLTLNVGHEPEVVISPRSNDLLHFEGSLVHAVDEVDAPGLRISLVCEQYNLPEAVLQGFPEFEVIQDADVAPRVGAVHSIEPVEA